MKKLLALCLTMMIVSSHGISAKKSITIKGSTTVLPISQAVAERFMDLNPDIDISVQGGGSGVGIASIIEGTCDIGNSSRSISDRELQSAAVRGRFPKANVVAMDGIAVIVHPNNPLKGLTKKQVKDIYTGKISDWSELGGSSGKIVVFSRDTASGTFEAFNELALDKTKVRPDALMEASNRGISAKIGQTPQGIGYIGLGYITSSVKALPINGVVPTKETVLSKKYVISRPLFMYTNANPEGSVKEFLDFLMSKEGQALVEEVGFVALHK